MKVVFLALPFFVVIGCTGGHYGRPVENGFHKGLTVLASEKLVGPMTVAFSAKEDPRFRGLEGGEYILVMPGDSGNYQVARASIITDPYSGIGEIRIDEVLRRSNPPSALEIQEIFGSNWRLHRKYPDDYKIGKLPVVAIFKGR